MTKSPKTAAAARKDAPATNNPESEDRLGGGGNSAIPAEIAPGPLLTAALATFNEQHPGHKGPVLLRVVAPRGGFRRAGIAHTGTRDFGPDDGLTPDQVEQLLAEPRLQVSFVPGENGAAE